MLQLVPPKILMLIFWVPLEEIMEWISVLLFRPSARSVSFRCSGAVVMVHMGKVVQVTTGLMPVVWAAGRY